MKDMSHQTPGHDGSSGTTRIRNAPNRTKKKNSCILCRVFVVRNEMGISVDFCGFLRVYRNGLFNLNTPNRIPRKDSRLLYRKPVVRNEMEDGSTGMYCLT